jgi:hypothetical protein
MKHILKVVEVICMMIVYSIAIVFIAGLFIVELGHVPTIETE